MLVVVAVLGVLLIVGVPSMIGQLRKTRLQAAANDITNLMNQTRLRAIRDSTTREVRAEPDRVTISGLSVVGDDPLARVELEYNSDYLAVFPPGPAGDPRNGVANCFAHLDGTVYGGDATSTVIAYDATGEAEVLLGDDRPGAICLSDGLGNVLQVALDFPTGEPQIRKYLEAADAPGDAGFYLAPSLVPNSGYSWAWY